jgi:F-type H+-transporting ATPase subunit epsilon
MRLKVILPREILIDNQVTKIIAEGVNGSFCLLPRHIDFISALVPGILTYFLPDGQQLYLAVDEGILVKCGGEVFVSTLNAIQDDDLNTLKQTVVEQFRVLDEQEKLTRSALAKFEVNIMRRFQELGHG